MIDELKDKYLEDICATIPLHRVVIVGLGFVASLIIEQRTHLSIAETLWNLRFSSLSFESGGLLENAQLSNIAIGLLISLIAWALNSTFNRAFFTWTMRKLGANAKILAAQKALAEKLKGLTKPSIDYLPVFEKRAVMASREVSKFANLAEFFLGLSLCAGFVSYFGGTIDKVLLGVFLLVSISMNYWAILCFFRKYLKFDLLRQAIFGALTQSEYSSINARE